MNMFKKTDRVRRAGIRQTAKTMVCALNYFRMT